MEGLDSILQQHF
uniref:Uncharacterized protein n=1 Tax=Arundo donax TaxID=35708 RepID=A0A0A9C8L0_ARUDO